MEIMLVIIAFLLLVGGVIGSVVPILPGLPLSIFGLLLLQWSGYGGFSTAFLLTWAAIAATITVMDYFLPALLAKRFGGSRYAVIGSFLGLLAGIFFFPPLGMIAGPFLGALAGELIRNSKDGARAIKVAFGAFLAFIVGAGAKLIASSVMLFFAVKSLF
jgi:uncharacterized protein YqgC (DUF456 family)